MTDTDEERAKFEAAWLALMGDAVWLERADLNGQGDRLTYCERRTRDAWWAWQARAAQDEAVLKDAERLDWLQEQGRSYGFEDMHEGNAWEVSISGPYANLRAAIDAALHVGGVA